MSKITKREKAIKEVVKPGKSYGLDEAITLLKDISKVKFDESIELVLCLGIDARKSEQNVRGATLLPNGTGKKVRVAVFASGSDAENARAAGADIVGYEDLADSIKAGNCDFDVVVATPDSMKLVGQLGQVLGPRGLMPNPKVGTVTNDIVQAIKNVKSGQVRFKNDKNGLVHCAVGKASFESKAIRENILAVLQDVKKLKPSVSKGVFLKKIYVSSSMGPGLLVDQSTF